MWSIWVLFSYLFNLRKFLLFLENPEIQIGGRYYHEWRHKTLKATEKHLSFVEQVPGYTIKAN